MKKLFSLMVGSVNFHLILISSALLFTACSSCSKQEQKPADDFDVPTEFEQKLTEHDTAKVKELVEVFLDHLRHERYYDAAGMLSKLHHLGDQATPEEYDNDDIERFVNVHKMFDVEDYSIEYIRFRESKQNEVCVNVIMRRGQNGQKDITTKFFLNPIFFNGSWELVLDDSPTGTKAIVPAEKRDSMKHVYEDSQKAPAAK